jgi:hypothetical protein
MSRAANVLCGDTDAATEASTGEHEDALATMAPSSPHDCHGDRAACRDLAGDPRRRPDPGSRPAWRGLPLVLGRIGRSGCLVARGHVPRRRNSERRGPRQRRRCRPGLPMAGDGGRQPVEADLPDAGDHDRRRGRPFLGNRRCSSVDGDPTHANARLAIGPGRCPSDGRCRTDRAVEAGQNEQRRLGAGNPRRGKRARPAATEPALRPGRREPLTSTVARPAGGQLPNRAQIHWRGVRPE